MPAEKKVDVRKALNLKLQGWSYRKIGEEMGVSAAAVHKRIQALMPDEEEVKHYKENRADIFAGIQANLLKSLTDADIKKASLSQRLLGVGLLYDKERLERGQTTANIAMAIGEITPEEAQAAREYVAGVIEKTLKRAPEADDSDAG